MDCREKIAECGLTPPFPNGPTDGVTEKFTGKERDAETGLDFVGARYMSSAQGRFMTPDWSAKPQPIPYADLKDPQTLNLYGYVRNNPLSHADSDGHDPSDLVYDGDTNTITLHDKDGKEIGHWDANNNVQSSATVGKLVDGDYAFDDTKSPHMHGDATDAKGVKQDSEDGMFGSSGILRLKSFTGADDKTHEGVGVHSGRAGVEDLAKRSGVDFATNGCVRTTDTAMAKIVETAKTDPLTKLTVKNNREAPTPKPEKEKEGDRGEQ